MPYIEGFIAAVPTANRETYIEQAKQGAEYFKNLGATRVTECWGDDVPRGEVTDFFRATQAKDDETIIFSWIEYPDKATRDAANEKMAADAEMMEMEMPFDGSRMFWGGFQPVLDEVEAYLDNADDYEDTLPGDLWTQNVRVPEDERPAEVQAAN